ncbi:putative peptidoglycan lipid II flippase [Maritimibacter alkaliphilus HTCC2654]|uniref:Probable lipid II flippase MurJ n=1 Tax=Maritimibacter alkaliphilus HTCC2654 TaxID=314271 RepID=A3VHY1_9RHOB|nr:murein biosynthesis integral membrane protein MurJ [Maritimibacter alkaliphilus]EAQ12322.1 putative virulence factor, MviN [Rhodobacterales bacterium HTCC2654] [Maritimibacter alkaliphilus HTCC2654]TYP85391.1 putative peptidoglycan lipid II flippase [Maritimibacter alkaliphilus HTCC2654]
MASIRLLRGFLTVGGWTAASRVLGFVRDVAIAGALGAGPMAEAFFIAFSLPNMFRRFFAEGAFNTAFIPMFSKKVEAGEGAMEFARDALTGLATILLVLTVIAQIFMPALVLLMASGFAEDERLPLATMYGRIAFPYIFFISLAALLSGLLNAVGRFAAAAAAPLLLNVTFITAIIVASYAGYDIGLTLSWAVPIAGVAQLALVWFAAARAGYRLFPRIPKMTPELKRLAIIAGPAALAQGVVQVNLLVGRQVSSFFDGAIAWLNYADRLYQLPLGIVGIGIGVVLLPELSRRLQAGDEGASRWSLSRAGEIALLLTIPSAVALVVIPLPLVTVLFERGAFTADDSASTAFAVAVYGLGLPAFVLQKVLQPVYFARGNTKTPFYFALVSLVVNAALAIGLAPVIGYIAAAFGTTLAGWAMTIGLWIGTARMGESTRFDKRFWRKLWGILAASAVMGAELAGAVIVLGPMFGTPGLKVLALLILIASGTVTYFLAGRLFGAVRLSDLKAMMRRG